jgi:hypothetical protein
LPLHHGHDEEEKSAGFARIVEGEDVGMIESGSEPDLSDESLSREGLGDFGAEDLDGHVAIVAEVTGEEDGGHPARAELAVDAVVLGEGGGQRGVL